MPDSETEDKPKIQTLTIINPMTHKPQEIQKGPNGQFLPKKKRVATTKEIKDMLRKILSVRVSSSGKWGKKEVTRFEAMTMAMVDLVMDESGNPKIQAARVAAYKEVMLRAAGRPAVSDEEFEANQTAGIKIVIITPPDLMNKEIVQEKSREQLKPSFIKGEFTTNTGGVQTGVQNYETETQVL